MRSNIECILDLSNTDERPRTEVIRDFRMRNENDVPTCTKTENNSFVKSFAEETNVLSCVIFLQNLLVKRYHVIQVRHAAHVRELQRVTLHVVIISNLRNVPQLDNAPSGALPRAKKFVREFVRLVQVEFGTEEPLDVLVCPCCLRVVQ